MTDAANEYKRVRAECDLAVVRLQLVMNNHAARQAGHPTWWSFVGDLKKTRIDLLAACAFLGDDEAREIMHAEGVER